MAMSLEKAKQRASEVLATSHSARLQMMADCGLWALYAYADHQFARSTTGAGVRAVSQLAPVINPSSSTIRVSINRIREDIRLLSARIQPQRLDYETDPASQALNDHIGAQVGKRRLDIYHGDCPDKGDYIKWVLRRAVPWRLVFGSVIVRRHMLPMGAPVVLRNPDGTPKARRDGSERYLQTYGHRLSIVPPWEVARDPAARSPDWDGEDCVVHEKPTTVVELIERFGKRLGAARARKFLATKTTLGQFYQMQGLINSCCRGQPMGGSAGDSKAPAVLLGEAWLRDGTTGWPWHLVYVRDTSPESGEPEDRELVSLQWGENSYKSLPLHHYPFVECAGYPWGQSLPYILKPEQDEYNWTRTTARRTMLYQGNSPWVVYQGAFDVEDPAQLLDMRQDHPLKVKASWPHIGQVQPIQRLTPQPVDPNLAMILQLAGDGMDRSAMISAAQRGYTGKRGDAALDTQMKLEQADAPIEAQIADDESITNELLTGTLGDLMATDSVAVLREAFGGEFTDEALGHYIRQDRENKAVGVRVKQDTLRPMTRRERREVTQSDVQLQIVTPEQARFVRMLHGERVVPDEYEAIQLQQAELTLLKRGASDRVRVEEGHVHWVHLAVCRLLQNSPEWLTLGEEVQEAVRAHVDEHNAVQEAGSATAGMVGMGNGAQGMQPGGMEQPGEQYDMFAGGQSPGVIPFPQGPAANPLPQGGQGAFPGAPGAEQAIAM